MTYEIDCLNKQLPKNDIRRWQDVPGFEGCYVVSDDGFVGSLRRQVSTGRGRTRWVKTKVLKPLVRKKGGKVFSVCVNLTREGFPGLGGNVGRLVLMAFTGDQEGKLAHYKDGDSSNNSLLNMEWTTMSDIGVRAINGGYKNDVRIQGRLIF
jgi:hypothetical protein